MTKSLRTALLLGALSCAPLSRAAAADAITEDRLADCAQPTDCVVVPYQNCCGSTKRAINKNFLDLYESKPEWRKFDDPKKCAAAGACVSDKSFNAALCVKSGDQGRCQLIHADASKTATTPSHGGETNCAQDADCSMVGPKYKCVTEKIACPEHPESSTCERRVCREPAPKKNPKITRLGDPCPTDGARAKGSASDSRATAAVDKKIDLVCRDGRWLVPVTP